MSCRAANVLAAAVDLCGGLPCYDEGQRAQLLHEAYRLHFIYNAAHKTTATTTTTTTTNIRSIAALPLFFEHYDATGAALNLLGPPFAATDPCVDDPIRLAAAASAFFASTQRFWRHPAIVARKAQLVAREAYLDECPRVDAAASTSTSTTTTTTTSASDGIIDNADITTIRVVDMDAVQEALQQISNEAREARGVVRRMNRFNDPDADLLAEALHDVGRNVKEIQEVVRRVDGLFVEGGFQ